MSAVEKYCVFPVIPYIFIELDVFSNEYLVLEKFQFLAKGFMN